MNKINTDINFININIDFINYADEQNHPTIRKCLLIAHPTEVLSWLPPSSFPLHRKND